MVDPFNFEWTGHHIYDFIPLPEYIVLDGLQGDNCFLVLHSVCNDGNISVMVSLVVVTISSEFSSLNIQSVGDTELLSVPSDRLTYLSDAKLGVVNDGGTMNHDSTPQADSSLIIVCVVDHLIISTSYPSVRMLWRNSPTYWFSRHYQYRDLDTTSPEEALRSAPMRMLRILDNRTATPYYLNKWVDLSVGTHIDLLILDDVVLFFNDDGYCYNSHSHNTRAGEINVYILYLMVMRNRGHTHSVSIAVCVAYSYFYILVAVYL